MSEVPTEENFVNNDVQVRTSGNRFARYKVSGQAFNNAKAKWVFLKNPSTRFDPKWLVQIMIANDMMRLCNVYSVGSLYCNKKGFRNEPKCKKCVMKCVICDCHELLTDMFLYATAYYFLHIAKNKTQVIFSAYCILFLILKSTKFDIFMINFFRSIILMLINVTLSQRRTFEILPDVFFCQKSTMKMEILVLPLLSVAVQIMLR